MNAERSRALSVGTIIWATALMISPFLFAPNLHAQVGVLENNGDVLRLDLSVYAESFETIKYRVAYDSGPQSEEIEKNLTEDSTLEIKPFGSGVHSFQILKGTLRVELEETTTTSQEETP